MIPCLKELWGFMAILDRLIRKEQPGNLVASRVVQLDAANRQVQLTIRGATVWAAYDPSAFPALSAGDDILAAKASGSFYLVGTAPKTTPTRTTLIEV